MSDSVMIHVEGLTKDYGTGGKPAVDAISFDVRAGEVLGFLGPNGAGKTTTMKILTSYLAPSAGRAEVAGFDVYSQSMEVRKRLGYLPEDTPLYKDMTVLEYLDFISDIRGLPQENRRGRIKRAVEQVGIEHRLGSLIGELSRGLKQRVGIAQAIIHEPEVLILDEPTSGLDPNQIAEIRTVIKEIGKSKTVIFSTHILGEVQATCSRVIIIADGKLVADGTPDDLVRGAEGATEILVELGGERAQGNEPITLMKLVDGVEHVTLLSSTAFSSDKAPTALYRVNAQKGFDPRGDLAKVLATAEGMELLQLTPQRQSLEAVFKSLTTTAGAVTDSQKAAQASVVES